MAAMTSGENHLWFPSITMGRISFSEPARRRTHSIPLFSRKLLVSNLVQVIVINFKVFCFIQGIPAISCLPIIEKAQLSAIGDGVDPFFIRIPTTDSRFSQWKVWIFFFLQSRQNVEPSENFFRGVDKISTLRISFFQGL